METRRELSAKLVLSDRDRAVTAPERNLSQELFAERRSKTEGARTLRTGMTRKTNMSFVAGCVQQDAFNYSDSEDEEDSFKIIEEELPKKKTLLKIVTLVAVFTTAWWMCTILIVLTIKDTVMHGGLYPYPLCFTSFLQPLVGLMALIVTKAKDVLKPRKTTMPKFTKMEVATIFVFGAMQGFEQGLTNTALAYLTIATRTMVSSTSVFFMMLTARCWGLEKLDALRIVSALCMIGGGYMQTRDTHDDSGNGGHMVFIGVLLQGAAMTLGANRWALTQHIVTQVPRESALGQLKKLQLLAYCLPINGLVILPFAIVMQPDGFKPDNFCKLHLLRNMLTVGVALLIMLYAEMKLVKLLSAVAFQVLSTVHQIPIVLAGVYLNHDVVGWNAAAGFGCCIVGSLIYGAARVREGDESGH